MRRKFAENLQHLPLPTFNSTQLHAFSETNFKVSHHSRHETGYIYLSQAYLYRNLLQLL